MDKLHELIQNNDHTGIANLEGENFDSYKIVALIFLEKYKEALKLAKRNTFEFCYCLYKLKKYKNCVKMTENLLKKDTKSKDLFKIEGLYFLYAQSLYHLGYFNKSAEILNKFNKPSSLINLMATESLCLLAKNDKIFRYKIKAKDEYKKIITDFESNEFTKEQKEEIAFNKSFRFLDDENSFIKYLENNAENVLCANQLNNILGNFEAIDNEKLGKKQREVLDYNKENTEMVELEHFQKFNYEYDVLARNKDDFEFKTDNLRFLYALKTIKKKNTKKLIEPTKDCDIKRMFEALKMKDQTDIINALKQFQ